MRTSGLLLHPTSLPGPRPAGDLGREAFRFAEGISASGQTWWQMLPVCPPGAGASPYQSHSTFAGSPELVPLEPLVEKGWLDPADLPPAAPPSARSDPAAMRQQIRPLLRKAHAAFEGHATAEDRAAYGRFLDEHGFWIDDFALFEALREAHRGASWTDWNEEVRRRAPRALDRARETLAREIDFVRFVQFLFDRAWSALRGRCASLGLRLFGDLPLYVAHESADVWAYPELFALDADGHPAAVAGVPPDYFSGTGQRWGNPLYRWNVLAETGYRWWIERLRTTLARFDRVRLDHFIGYHNYWEIPRGKRTATGGRWVPGPGEDFFRAVFETLPREAFVAEDLGSVTDAVRDLRDRLALPGMRVLQFGFSGDPDNEHLPHNHPLACVAYTGTHDNNTTRGWWEEEIADPRRRAFARRYLGTDDTGILEGMLRHLFLSPADTAILPVQDLLVLGSEHRMNLPGTPDGNWRWRLEEGRLTKGVLDLLGTLTETYGRAPRRD